MPRRRRRRIPRARADDALDAHAQAALLEPADDDAVMAGVGDGDAVAVHGDLAG
jgi:hypothetical protein